VSDNAVTPLHSAHLAAGARMVPFAGYSMPVQYKSVIQEALAVRNGAGMFDVSHMARLSFVGEGVIEFLEHVTTNDISKLTDGTGQYSLLPNATGGLVDDIIVYRMSENEFRMVVNASNHAKDVAHLKAHLPSSVTMSDHTDETAMIAVQGPKAVEILAGLSDDPEGIRAAGMFGVVQTKIAGIDCFAPRSGYTGEDGYELICAASDAVALWDALVAAGVEPCGLGSRDTLRVEAGLPLYGHELSDELSPIAAGLGWVIGKTKTFIGSEFINAARAEGTPRRLVGVKMNGRRIPGIGAVVAVEGNAVGEVCSGVYSPVLECGIAFAFVDRAVEFGTSCTVDIRGSQEPATVVIKRFLKKG